MGYLKVLFKYEWELTKSPAGAYIWLAMNVDDEDMVVDAQDPHQEASSDDDHRRPGAEVRSRLCEDRQKVSPLIR
jgi:hypothetical protein